MWKKDESQAPTGQQMRSAAPIPVRDAAGRSGGERATIGRSITIRGDVTGDEDLLIQGRVEGTVDLKQHSVTVGPEGKVKANVTGKDVTIEGEVQGNLRAREHVVLRATARVDGDLSAPRVVIEEGAIFRGSIDMSEQADRGTPQRPVPAPPVAASSPTGPTPLAGGEGKEPAKH